MELSLHFEVDRFWSAVLYTNKYGIHAMFPQDVLHTVSKGLVEILYDILRVYLKGKFDMVDRILGIRSGRVYLNMR